MRTKGLLFLGLLSCVALVGCTEENTGVGSTINNGVSDAALVDAGDTAVDAVDDAAGDTSTDTAPTQCTSDEDCNGNPNQVGLCETSTNTCTYSCDDGFADCDGDSSTGCEVAISEDADNCGACGNVCDPTLNQLPICTDGACDVDPEACTDGYVDLNGQGGDGCECEITEANDLPDGEDTNCDGVDGIIDGEDANAVFVSPEGDDTADGLSPDTAVQTLSVAIGIADDEERAYVLAAGGTYVERLELEPGVSIFGGYEPADGWSRNTEDEEHITTIAPTVAEFDADELHYKTITAVDIDEPTTLDGLTIEGVDAADGDAMGASTYAVWANNADELSIEHSHVLAGIAADGDDGDDATSGVQLLDNEECSPPEGGAGATADSAEEPCSGSAYDGARANSGLDGDLADVSKQQGIGGLGGIHHCGEGGTNAEDGRAGAPGEDGDNGQPADSGVGSVDDNGHWTLGAGTQPSDGEHGGGGGGGGAGGNFEGEGLLCGGDRCFGGGGNGGDGGNGGCAAAGSTNGQPGGGSFGVAIVAGSLTITDTTITLGSGGTGGSGGDGALGGSTNLSGESGDPGETAAGKSGGAGGNGGPGGPGGHAGAGAGGCGGAAFGIMTAAGVDFEADDSVTVDDDDVEPAAGGAGGAEAVAGSTAAQGCTGEVAQTQAYDAD